MKPVVVADDWSAWQPPRRNHDGVDIRTGIATERDDGLRADPEPYG